MSDKVKIFIYFIIGAFVGILAMYLFNNYRIEKKNPTENSTIFENKNHENPKQTDYSRKQYSQKNNEYKRDNTSEEEIDELTKEEAVIPYLKKNGVLPEYYITKSEAKSYGWVPSKGNLCEVLPGRAIGGDIWSNRQKSLPVKSGRKYFEADLNYHCGNRNANRVVFSNDGLVFVTYDHYKTFQEK